MSNLKLVATATVSVFTGIVIGSAIQSKIEASHADELCEEFKNQLNRLDENLEKNEDTIIQKGEEIKLLIKRLVKENKEKDEQLEKLNKEVLRCQI